MELVIFWMSFFMCLGGSFVYGQRNDITARCMRTKSCTVSKINKELSSMGGADDLVKVLSWNVEGIPAQTICKSLEQLDSEVIGLQRVTRIQFSNILTTCMKNYNSSGIPYRHRFTTETTFNPIFYKNDHRINTEISSGTYQSLSWTRLTFQSPKPRRNRRSILGENLLNILSGQRAQKKYARAIRRKFYRKQVFFVNVNLNDDDENKKSTLKKLLTHLYFKTMERRRHRAILFGTLGWDSSAKMLRSFMRRRRRGSQKYFGLFRRAMKTSTAFSTNMKKILNQIWQTNTKSKSSFKSVMAAVVETNTKNKPTFQMFLM